MANTHGVVVEEATQENADEPAHGIGHVVEPKVHGDFVLRVQQ